MRRFGGPRCWRALGVLAALAGLAQCTAPPSTLEQIHARGELRVGTLNLPTTYYIGAQGPEGIEYLLARDFARSLDVRLAITPYENEQRLRAALRSGEIDIAAAQLTYRGPWRLFALPSRNYDQVAQLVVHVRGTVKPKSPRDLSGRRIVVKAESPQAETLAALRHAAIADLEWQELPVEAINRPLDVLAAGDADITIVDAPEFRFIRQAYPEIQSAFELRSSRPVQWIVRRRSNALRASVDAFLGTDEVTQQVAAAAVIRIDPSPRMQSEMARAFRAHIDSRLPLLRPWFEEAARETALDWRLLAAIAYQESQWDRDARSPNGALGIMMLMPATAASVGVSDPFDPRDNIHGGARYFVEVRGKLPARIPEPDRTSMALAAYNVGFGHLEDARIITQMRGGNPDLWTDVRASLPLLAQEGWYMQVRRGYARGWEPAQFVRRVRQFYGVLEWQTLPSIETALQVESELLPPAADATEVATQ
ncbi:MAG: membrane-bound lytic murein transglycosylase MltF [Steroidobacteraceae bacterium]|nr:membrane-bound lytic murein transglycosylase MltF [Steroidobacteraceae bacterium]